MAITGILWSEQKTAAFESNIRLRPGKYIFSSRVLAPGTFLPVTLQ